MNPFCDNLKQELESQLKTLAAEICEPLPHARQALALAMTALERLDAYIIQYRFENEADEIDFYRNKYPLFLCEVLYFRKIYILLLQKPPGGNKAMCQYYKAELSEIGLRFATELEFCRYYRSGNTLLDALYFTKAGQKALSGKESLLVTNSPSHILAAIRADELLAVFLEDEILKLKKKKVYEGYQTTSPLLKWSGSKTALVELIYALHSGGVFNSGAASLVEIAGFAEGAFGVELGQFHRTFLEIRGRKSDRAKFLNSLREKLLARMDDADEK